MNTRRHFLKVAGLSSLALAGGVGATVLAQAAGEAAYTTRKDALSARRWAMVIDTRRFETFEDFQKIINVCHQAHNVPHNPGPQEVKWIWDDTFEHTFTDDPSPMLPANVETRRFFMLCNHCTNPSCVRVCPAGATYLTPGGVVAIDYHRCVGCRFCMAACPYGSRSFNFKDPRPAIASINPEFPTRMSGVVEKCTFCADRLEKGQLPACVEASDGAILFGDINDAESDVRKALAENFSMRRKPSLGTDPGVYYII